MIVIITQDCLALFVLLYFNKLRGFLGAVKANGRVVICSEYQYKDPGSLCEHVFLMADKASVDSVIHRTDDQQPYIIAVDDGNHTYEMSDEEDDSDDPENANTNGTISDNDNEGPEINAKSQEEKHHETKEKNSDGRNGTLRVHIEWLLSEFYLGEIRHDGVLLEDLVGYSKPGYVWSGMMW